MNTTTSSSLRSSNWRWVICTLLFFATTINYLYGAQNEALLDVVGVIL